MLRIQIMEGKEKLPETKNKCISYKIMATIISTACFANPCNSLSPTILQNGLKSTKGLWYAVKMRWIQDFVNKVIIIAYIWENKEVSLKMIF